MTKKEIMEQLYLTEEDVFENGTKVMEKLFCVAIINQGTDMAEKIFSAYLVMRDILYSKE